MTILGKLRHNKKMAIVVAAVFVVLVGTLIAYLVFLRETPSGEARDKAESTGVIQEVSELYILPNGEEPTVASITNKSKLSSQQFFENAQNGDYLIVYSKAKIALIYRQSVHKLVNAGSINPNGTQESNAAAGQ